MKRAITVATVLTVVAIGGAAFWAVAGGKGASSCDPAACETGAKTTHVRVGADDYVTCCDTCAEKLRENPRQFVRA